MRKKYSVCFFAGRLLKGQSILEYVLLVIAVATAFMAMNVYIRRAVNARLHTIEIEISPPIVVE